MKKLLTGIILCAFLFSGMVMATETRTLTMGNVNGIVKDEANVLMFPSTINYYPKLVGGEIRSSEDYVNKSNGDEFMTDFFVHWTFAENSNPMTLGTYFYTNDDGIRWPYILQDEPPFYLDWSPAEYFDFYDKKNFNDLSNRRIVLTYGRKLNDMPFGFTFDYTSAKQEEVDTITSNNDYKNSLSRFGFTFGLSPMEGQLDLAAGIAFTSWKWQYDDTDLVKPDGNMAFNFNMRYWMDPKGKYTLVPHLSFDYEKQGAKEMFLVGTSFESDNYEAKFMHLMAGLGMNYNASEDVLLVGDFGVGYWNDKFSATEYNGTDPDTTYEDKYTNFILPYFKAGIDANIFKWLDFRGGVESYWMSEKYELGYSSSNEEEDKYNFVSTRTYLGAGFNWNKLNIDTQIDPDFLMRGPYFVSGESDYLAVKVSLVYWVD